MSLGSFNVRLSPIDEERFGVRSARASNVRRDALPELLGFCRENDVIFLIARCPVKQVGAAQAMEKAGFLLMDTLVYSARNLYQLPVSTEEHAFKIRPIRSGEEYTVRAIAQEAFRGYFGHYHADPNLDQRQCDAIYPDWAFRSCISKEAADEVLVAELEDAIVGFFTLRLNTPDEGEGVLSGIAPAARRRGIYRSFIVRGMEWCQSAGVKRMIVSTQITNIAVQKVWTRLGFEPSRAFYTFHKWFNEGEP